MNRFSKLGFDTDNVFMPTTVHAAHVYGGKFF